MSDQPISADALEQQLTDTLRAFDALTHVWGGSQKGRLAQLADDAILSLTTQQAVEDRFQGIFAIPGLHDLTKTHALQMALYSWCGDPGRYYTDPFVHAGLVEMLRPSTLPMAELLFREGDDDRSLDSLLSLAQLKFRDWEVYVNDLDGQLVQSPRSAARVIRNCLAESDSVQLVSTVPGDSFWGFATDEEVYYTMVEGAGIRICVNQQTEVVDGFMTLKLTGAWVEPMLPPKHPFYDRRGAKLYQWFQENFSTGPDGILPPLSEVTIDFAKNRMELIPS